MKFVEGFKKVAWEINQQAAADFSRGAQKGYGSDELKAGWQNIKNQLGFGNAPKPQQAGTVERAGG